MNRASILAIFLWCPLLCTGQQQSAPSQNQAESSSATVEARVHEEEAKAQTDAAIQEAASNGWIKWFTGALVFAAFVQAGIYYFQSRLMRESIEQNRKASQIELRPYVAIIEMVMPDLEVDPPKEGYYSTELRFENDGKTPALSLITHFFWDSVAGSGPDIHLPTGYKFPGLDSVSPAFLIRTGSNVVISSGTRTSTWHTLLDKDHGFSFQNAADKFVKDEVTIFFFAKITYQDVFEETREPHVTTRCWRLGKDGPDKTRLISYDMFNDMT